MHTLVFSHFIASKPGILRHCSKYGKADHNKKGHQKYLDRLGEQSQNNIIDEDEELNIPSIVEVHFLFCANICSSM
jgi:hypothetical protein